MYEWICIISIVCLIYFLVIKVDNTVYFDYVNKYNLYLKNAKLARLLNADSLGNLPNVYINSTNVEIEKAKNCTTEPVYLGPTDQGSEDSYLKRCIDVCGSLGHVVHINEEMEYYQNSKKLQPGSYCMIESESTKCNLNTGYVVATGLGSVVCKSKYPNMFGGSDASQIIACSDERHPASGGVLWDNYNNYAVEPTTVIMSEEDEKLFDGSFRFTCKYNDNLNKNKMIPHPANRFHPINDPCLLNVYAAHRSAGVVLENDTWRCDCGDQYVTRLHNKDPNDPKSECYNCENSITTSGENKKYKISYSCFTINSNLTDTIDKVPCNSDSFVNLGSNCDVIELTTQPKADPYYAPFKSDQRISIL